MEECEDLGNSLPYIDDVPTDDDSNPQQYNLKIFENYHNRNRNIEIINRCPEDSFGKSLSPVAPLAEETELSDNRTSDSQEEPVQNIKNPQHKQNGMRLVIKGCNSSISIQGLDNKSSITFKRGQQQKLRRSEERKEKSNETSKSQEKPRKGRWKMLTRSLITKSSRFEKKGLDERYPKYVLLKDEEEEMGSAKESNSKNFAFKEGKKQKENVETKSEFNFKKSFKNKTKPMEENEMVEPVKAKEESAKKSKKPLTERAANKKAAIERRKSLTGEKIPKGKGNASTMAFAGCSNPQGQVFNEIQGIFEDTFKLCHEINESTLELVQSPPEEVRTKSDEYYSSVPPQYCHDPYCCFVAHNQPPRYTPVYNTGMSHRYKNSNTQTNNPEAPNAEVLQTGQIVTEDVDLKNLQFGILSSFFPRVVIMKTFSADDEQCPEKQENVKGYEFLETEDNKTSSQEKKLEDVRTVETLEVPQPDLTIKSKMVQELTKPEAMEFYQSEIYINNDPLSSDEEHRTKTDESEATEYLHYCENEPLGNESIQKPNPPSPPPKYESKDDKVRQPPDEISEEAETSKTLSLTKIGYKMYDNLTKLSLNREKEIIDTTEVSGCGCNGNGTKKSPYNITLESNNGVVKVTVPETELNFQILNSQAGDIQIGLAGGRGIAQSEKKIARKGDLWHSDHERKPLVVAPTGITKGSQKVKVSLADSKDVLLSIEMSDRDDKEEKIKEKSTKEKKIGTDDLNLAGGDFVCTLDESYKNLSPRTGRILKNLQEKLEFGERERKFLAEKINEKITDQKFQGRILPGIFMLKQISPRADIGKKPIQVPPTRQKTEVKDPGKQLREYYCEECLATMRIFEDENPSVKSMVDKFETIIQLESY